MSDEWKRELQIQIGAGPDWGSDDYPMCAPDCVRRKGNVCVLTESVPSHACRPMIGAMAQRLSGVATESVRPAGLEPPQDGGRVQHPAWQSFVKLGLDKPYSHKTWEMFRSGWDQAVATVREALR